MVHEGSRFSCVYLILEGFAYRYKYLPDGKRQILGYLITGDTCDVHFVIFNQCDHTVGLLSDAHVAMIQAGELMDALVRYPNIERALLLATLVDGAVTREWLLNVGQRGALQRLAHFFCEISARLQAIGLANPDGSFSIPVTQVELADTVGLSTVHVNRTLQRLRNDGLIGFTHRRLTILDPARLVALAGFDQKYLRIEEEQIAPQIRTYA